MTRTCFLPEMFYEILDGLSLKLTFCTHHLQELVSKKTSAEVLFYKVERGKLNASVILDLSSV